MSVLLIEANKNGKYEFNKDELQELLDKVEQEAFEHGVLFGRKVKESNEKEYIYINNPINPIVDPFDTDPNWNDITC